MNMKSSVFFSVIWLLAACTTKSTSTKALPYIGNYDIEYKLVNGVEVVDTVYPKVPFFYFLNHDSVVVKSTDMKGKIWIADFFFTTCPTICPTMTKNLKYLNSQTRDIADELQFISFTINPLRDTPSQLRKYRSYYGATAGNWQFLTGDEQETHQLGIENFQVFAGRDDESEGGYAHSGAFTLIDREGYVRGVYLGTDKEQVKQLEKDIRKLLKIEYGIIG